MAWCRSAIFKHDEVCHVGEVFKVMDDKQRTSTLDDRPPVLGGMSLAKVGLGDIERHSPLSALVLPHSG